MRLTNESLPLKSACIRVRPLCFVSLSAQLYAASQPKTRQGFGLPSLHFSSGREAV